MFSILNINSVFSLSTPFLDDEGMGERQGAVSEMFANNDSNEGMGERQNALIFDDEINFLVDEADLPLINQIVIAMLRLIFNSMQEYDD